MWGGVWFGGGGQGGCERRIEVFVKIKKKELKFLRKFKKKLRGGGGGQWGVGLVGWVG